MVESAPGRAVIVETPVAEGAVVELVEAGVAVPASGGVSVRSFSYSSFCLLVRLPGSVEILFS